MEIERITNYESDENCYIVYDENKEGFLIDPGSSSDIILDFLKEKGIKIIYILLTHCHYDHIEGLSGLRNALRCKVVSSFECNINIQNSKKNLSVLFSEPMEEYPSDIIVSDNEIIECGKMKIKVITTPGHTNGSVCYLIEDTLFSGDTLFLRSVGRWDFPTGDEKKLTDSIKNKLYILDDETIVYPGHGNTTKIQYEKTYNMYVKG